MGTCRFFTKSSLSPGGEVTLTDSEHHHLKNVRRLSPGESLSLIDGKGSIADAQIERIERAETLVRVTALETLSPPDHRWTLAMALIRPKLLEFAIEKAIELGVDRFVLFSSDYSEARAPSPDRLETIAVGALKQSGRLFLPEIECMNRLTLPDEPLFFGSLGKEARPLDKLPKQASFFIGPEGGFSKDELELFKAATPIYLGPHILRAETAAIAMAASIARSML